ncbi:MAG: EAL domain-containing protein, partial [Gammaproteobacteria bacterium]|nr:EAL domain-containing protein [Gammaproteobacteria bacterium]
YLKSLPVNYLKIDGGFVKDICNDEIDRAMVESIQQVGKAMKLDTIAEHVEDEAALIVLKEIGVDFAQGYHLGKPAIMEEK